MRRVLLPFLFLFAALVSSAHAEPRKFRLVGGQVIVTVTLQGREFPALLDTGASTSLIRLDLASELGIRSRKTGLTRGVSGKKLSYGRTQKVVLDFGAGPMRRSIGTLPGRYSFAEEGISILIGMDFLHAAVVSLDFQTMTVDFQRSSAFVAPTAPPLRLTDSGWRRPTLTVDLAGAQANLLLDTAASTALHLDSAFVAKVEDLKSLPTSTVTITGIDGVGDYDAINVPRVVLGDQLFRNVPASSAPLGHLNVGSTRIDGLVGVDLLKRFNWVMDFGNLRVWVTPHAPVRQDHASKTNRIE